VPEIDPVIVVDGANGVGASKLLELQKRLDMIKIFIRNTGQDDIRSLNFQVGADYVQKEKVMPQSFDKMDLEGRRYSLCNLNGTALMYVLCLQLLKLT
jgi:phosphoacetylglucosamine mutase